MTSHHILAVEDSPTQAEALRELLERAGHRVEMAMNGEDALRLLNTATTPFDVIISDIVMPGPVDGYALCQQVKAGPHRHTPVVLLTSLADPLDIIKGLESGADNFFTKPFEPQHLLERLAWLLDTRNARRATKMRMGVQVYFMGREFMIGSEREQILDLLISTFEDAVRQNRDLRQREAELETARAELARYAGGLETDLQRFFELSTDMIGVAGFDGYFKRVNPAWERWLGWTETELQAQPYLHFVHPADQAPTIDEVARITSGLPTLKFENRYRCRDGSYRWLEWRAIPSSEDALIFAIARDVTERRHAQRALEVRVRQQAAVATLGHAVIERPDMNVLLNVGARLVAETLDVPLTEVCELSSDGRILQLRAGIGWQPDTIGATIPADGDTMIAHVLRQQTSAVLDDASAEHRFRISEMEAAHGVTSAIAVTIPLLPGRPFGVLGAAATAQRAFTQDDVHFLQAVAHILGAAIERDRSDRALQQGQRLESVGRLAGGIAHDFNNLLTVILAHSELLKAELPPNAPESDDIDQISEAATRAAGLTRQLLAFSRRQVLEPRVLDLNETVADIEKMLRRLIGADISLSTSLQSGLYPVLADPAQIEQVIVNLAVNARDAMPAGGLLTITTANVELDAAFADLQEGAGLGPHVALTFSDTGHGMDRDTQARIFEPFFTTKGPERGTGLGLATVYGIVKQSSGTIGVYSEPGHGTTFRIYLPMAGEAGEMRAPSAMQPVRAAGGDETILLVEDEENVRKVAARVLRQFGYQVLEAADGEAALALNAGHMGRIDLLVSDVMMPRIGGGLLASALLASRPGLRVLHLSGHSDPNVVEEGLRASGAAFLQKPFTVESLSRKVRELLDMPGSGRHMGNRRATDAVPDPAHRAILVVDDEPAVLTAMQRMLRHLGYPYVKTADRAGAALALFDGGTAVPNLVLLDLNMPEVDGMAFVRGLVERGYQGQLILVSGEDERILQTVRHLVQAHGITTLGHLQKPVPMAALRDLLERWTVDVRPEGRPARPSYSPQAVRRALEHDELELHFQPKVEVATGACIGAEALVRWRHPKDGLIFPDQFIGVAEAHGLIDDLTRAVVRRSLAQARRWRDEGLALRVAINVSMDNLKALDFADFVIDAVGREHLSPSHVALEVTESRLMQDQRGPLETLTRLRLKRFSLSIDDFGTGHSSLAQLRDVPFDELKIDRSFVHGVASNDTVRAIYSASLSLASQLRMHVVAEGVENREDWEFLRQTGCGFAQGYWIGRPMPAADFGPWLASWQARLPELGIPATQPEE